MDEGLNLRGNGSNRNSFFSRKQIHIYFSPFFSGLCWIIMSSLLLVFFSKIFSMLLIIKIPLQFSLKYRKTHRVLLDRCLFFFFKPNSLCLHRILFFHYGKVVQKKFPVIKIVLDPHFISSTES